MILNVLSSLDAQGRAACGWSVGAHMTNVFMYTAVLTLIISWTWRQWLRVVRHHDETFLRPHAAMPVPPMNRADSADLDVFNSPSFTSPKDTAFTFDQRAQAAEKTARSPSNPALPSSRALELCTRFSLIWGNVAVIYQLTVMPFYLFAHIGVLVFLLTSNLPPAGQWAPAIMAFDIMFLVSLASSLGYFVVSIVAFRCITKRHLIRRVHRGPRGSL